MPWFRLDDSFHSHPKVIRAGNEAVGLFVRCGTYAAQHLTDGFVPEEIVLLYGSPALAGELVRAKAQLEPAPTARHESGYRVTQSSPDGIRVRRAIVTRHSAYHSPPPARHLP